MLLDKIDCDGSKEQRDTGNHHHHILGREFIGITDGRKDDTTEERANNLRNTDGAVEQSKVCTNVTTLERVGENRERPRQHSRPRATDKREGNEKQVRIGEVTGGNETDSSENQTESI